MSKKYAVILFVSFFFLVGRNAWAHHPASGAGIGKAGPIRTVSAATLAKGKWAVALQTEHIKFDRFSDDQMKGFAAEGNDAHSVDSVYHSIIGIGYGITDDFTFSLKDSYEYLNNIREVHMDEPDEIHSRGDAKGFGDLTLTGQYRFINNKEDAFESAIIFGLKLPTGNTSDKDIHGERFETEFQPGSGSWNPMAGIAATKKIGKASLDANLLYTVAKKGSLDTDLGDMLNYNAALSYRIGDKKLALDLIIEANGEWKRKQKIKGVDDPNSGGNTAFLSPGMRLSVNNSWSAYVSAGFPVLQDLNGIQNDTKLKTLFGISIGF